MKINQQETKTTEIVLTLSVEEAKKLYLLLYGGVPGFTLKTFELEDFSKDYFKWFYTEVGILDSISSNGLEYTLNRTAVV